MRRIVLVSIAISIAAIAAGSALNEPRAELNPLEITNPSAPGSLAPGLYAAPNDSLILTWIEPSGTGKALRFAFWNRWPVQNSHTPHLFDLLHDRFGRNIFDRIGPHESPVIPGRPRFRGMPPTPGNG